MLATADVVSALQPKFPSVAPRTSADHAAINVSAAEALPLLRSLRDEMRFDFLCDVTAIDWSAEVSPRFTVVWHLFSTATSDYLRVASDCTDDAQPAMASAVELWPAANWHERECFDMFGIQFPGHPDLRRILMWDGYPYHPLRKEFPLAGLPTDLPDAEIAAEIPTKVISAPMAGGPFVASSGEMNLTDSEPRAKDESWNERREKPNT